MWAGVPAKERRKKMQSNRKTLSNAIDRLKAASITITDQRVIEALEAIQAELEDIKQSIGEPTL